MEVQQYIDELEGPRKPEFLELRKVIVAYFIFFTKVMNLIQLLFSFVHLGIKNKSIFFIQNG